MDIRTKGQVLSKTAHLLLTNNIIRLY